MTTLTLPNFICNVQFVRSLCLWQKKNSVFRETTQRYILNIFD